MNLDQKLDGVLGRHRELSDQVASHPSPGSPEYTVMLKEYSDLTPMVERITELRAAQSEIGDLAGLIADQATDAEMRALAELRRGHDGRVPQQARRWLPVHVEHLRTGGLFGAAEKLWLHEMTLLENAQHD